MNLGEILDHIEQFDDEMIIYAVKPWSKDSDAQAAEDDGSTVLSGDFEYLLDIDTILDVIEAWSIHRDGAIPTAAERCEAVLYYEAHDSYLAPEDYDPFK